MSLFVYDVIDEKKVLSICRDLNLEGAYRLDNRPSLAAVQKAFRGAKITALVGSMVLTVILILIWPSVMVAVSVMSRTSFFQWVSYIPTNRVFIHHQFSRKSLCFSKRFCKFESNTTCDWLCFS